MTHPRDRVYQFATADQWSAGRADGLVRVRTGSDSSGLATPGSYAAARLPGSTREDAGARLALDPSQSLVWLRSDGTLWRHEGEKAFRIAHISPELATNARRFLWGQNFGWVLTSDALVRIDVARGARHGTFRDRLWLPDAIAEDVCDGVILVERHPETCAIRIKRIRADGLVHIIETELTSTDRVLSSRKVEDGRLCMVLRISDGWHIAEQPLGDAMVDVETFNAPPEPAGALAAIPGGGLVLTTTDGKLFSAGLGHIGPTLEPLTENDCGIGDVDDLIWAGDALVASTDSGLWLNTADHASAPAQKSVWVSPVLMSPLGQPDGWQRADFKVVLPEGAEMTISAHGFASETEGEAARTEILTVDPLTDPALRSSASHHFGVGHMVCRHYLGDIEAEFLVLRAQITLPPCAGEARFERLQVLYPNRSLIEDLPAIYGNDPVSAGQMRRSLVGFQALIDELDDKITEATTRLDPEKTDPHWAGFLLHWLGHGELSRLPETDRLALLQALPDIMRMRGTLPGLARVMDILAPGAYRIEDSGLTPDFWLLPIANDPAGARLGAATRLGHNDPAPLSLGGCTPLGGHVLGEVCGCATPSSCSADVTVRIVGGPEMEARLRPFTDAIARTFAPAHTRLIFLFTDHVPPGRLGFGPGLDDLTLDENHSRALGQWQLPNAGTLVSPEEPAVLDHATLNGNLVLE